MSRAVGLWRDIERVVHLSRGVIRRDVQLGEIVVVIFDIGTFGDREAQIGEDRGDFIKHLRHGMDRALRLGARGQSHVDALLREARVQCCVAECRFARSNRGRHAVAQSIEERAVLAPFVGTHAAQRLQQLADGALLAQRRYAHGFQRGFIGRARNGVQNLAP